MDADVQTNRRLWEWWRRRYDRLIMANIRKMRLALYEGIIKKFYDLNQRDCEDELAKAFPGVPRDTLRCIVAQEVQRKTKRTYHRLTGPSENDAHYKFYTDCAARNEPSGFLVRYADKIGLSPSLLARVVLEKHLAVGEQGGKQRLNEALRDTTSIEDPMLAVEVFFCTLADDVYGPLSDVLRHSIGLQYEMRLKDELKRLGLTFVDEEILRERGYDKTPDVKLEIPVAVGDIVITWVESKALFGDSECHKTYCKEQYRSYWNRFGKGLVIYWFGYIDELDRNGDDGVIIRDRVPENIKHISVENT